MNPLTRLKSTISTVTSTLQAVRELPGAVKEVVEFVRRNGDNVEVNRAYQLVKNLATALEIDMALDDERNKLRAEVKLLNDTLCDLQTEYSKELVAHKETEHEENDLRAKLSAITSEANELARELESSRRDCQQKLDLQWDAVKAMESDRDEALAKLARYEATEKWLSKWRWNRETPCQFPPDTFVQYRECEQVTPSSPNENHDNEPLKEMSHTCMVSELSDSDEWRPHVECLKFYEAFKDV